MERNFAAFTVSAFLLLAVSAAHVTFIPSRIDPSVVHYEANKRTEPKSDSEDVRAADPNILLPTEKPETEPVAVAETGSDPLEQFDRPTTQVFTIDTVFHPINRHFLDRQPRIPLRIVNRHPCRLMRPLVIPRTEISFGNDVILAEKTGSYEPEKFYRGVPSKWLRIKHHDGLRRHHKHHHDHEDHDEEEHHHQEHMPKYIFDRERLQSMSRRHHHQHKEEEKRQHLGGFMKSIRKFLKHTFD